MNVLVLIPYLYGYVPSQRSSIELWEPILKNAGIHLHFVPFETERLHDVLQQTGHLSVKAWEMIGAFANRIKLLQNLDAFDAVFIHREAALFGPALLEKWIARQGKPIIYQFDDPIYVPYRSKSNGYLSYLKFFGKVAEICRLSRVVIVNSTQIKEYATQFNSNVWQIPSIVDTEKYVFYPPQPNSDSICIGWSGSPTTVNNMLLLADVLKELGQKVKHQIQLIGGTEFDLPGVKYTAQNWKAETEIEDLRKIQIGLVPLPVTEWNKRKFYMKVVQYMALGIPSVCTPLGSNLEVIEHGVTGFLAHTHSEWVDYLQLLIKDNSLRIKMSYNCVRVAQEKYSLKANTQRVIEAFRAAVA